MGEVADPQVARDSHAGKSMCRMSYLSACEALRPWPCLQGRRGHAAAAVPPLAKERDLRSELNPLNHYPPLIDDLRWAVFYEGCNRRLRLN